MSKLTNDQRDKMEMALNSAKEREHGYNEATRTFSLVNDELRPFQDANVTKVIIDGQAYIVNVLAGTVKASGKPKASKKKAAKKTTKETPKKAQGKTIVPQDDQENDDAKSEKKKKTPKKKTKKEDIKEEPIEAEEPLPDDDPLELEDGNDLLIWVGYHFYPTIAEFVDEATEMGYLKKVRKIPDGFEPGKSKVFVAHNEGFEGIGVIIGCCLPEVKKGKIGEYPKRRDGSDISDPKAVYLTGEFKAFKDLVNIKGETKSKAIRLVNGEAILKTKCYTSSPRSRTKTVVKVDRKKIKTHWTEDDRKTLAKLVKSKEGNLNVAFREFSIATGRSLRSVEYQWYGPMKKLEMQ